jgi:hypothetical protein
LLILDGTLALSGLFDTGGTLRMFGFLKGVG